MATTIHLSTIVINSTHTLCARDEENSRLDIITIVTSLIGVVVAIIGLVQGLKCLQRRRHRVITEDLEPSTVAESPAIATGNNAVIYIYSILMSMTPVFRALPVPERDVELALPVMSTIAPMPTQEPGNPTVG